MQNAYGKQESAHAKQREGQARQNGKSAEEAAPTVVGGTTFKVPRTSTSTQAFRSVPRAWHARNEEKTRALIPHVGEYRPRYTCNQPRTAGNVAYGDKSVWEQVGRQQAQRIQKAQFEEGSKLCMKILRSLDQEQVDLNKNRDLKTQIYIHQKEHNQLLKIQNLLQRTQQESEAQAQ